MKQRELHWGRLALLLGLLLGGCYFWQSPLLLPFKLLAVMGHETGHAVATWIVGGSVQKITVQPHEAGECLSMIPEGFFARVAVSSGGYVGGAVIAVLLLTLSFRFNRRRSMLAAACVWLGFMGVFFARDAFTIVFALGMAAVFGAGAKWLPDPLVGALNVFIAAFQALYAAMDLKSDLWDSAVRSQSDAAILASTTGVPAIIWAALWSLISVVVLLAGAWFALADGGNEPAQAMRNK